MDYSFKEGVEYAREMDRSDPLRKYRSEFHIPVQESGDTFVYLCGNSLGLQPKSTKSYLMQELEDWKNLGVEGHFHAKNPWMPYHEFLTKAMARVVGGLEKEVIVMNTLSVNLHLMMVSFYRPSSSRYKILIESDAFPSDRYAVNSQVAFHGYDVQDAVLELKPREGEAAIREEDIEAMIAEHGQEIALIMIGGVNYYTGQLFDLKEITRLGHEAGCMVGFDLAHGAGNVTLDLHNNGVDFATWCTYKYLNSGPGSIGGCFVHERHLENADLPRFAGWWGHNKESRFKMRDLNFDPIPTAEAWQLSNPPILSLAAIKASLDVFEEVGMTVLVEKSEKLTAYLEFLLDRLNNSRIRIITPKRRGCQLSIQVLEADKSLYEEITRLGVIADWREPDVIRVAPVPLYNNFEDVYRFVQIMKQSL